MLDLIHMCDAMFHSFLTVDLLVDRFNVRINQNLWIDIKQNLLPPRCPICIEITCYINWYSL